MGPGAKDYTVLVAGLLALGCLGGVIGLSVLGSEVPSVLTGALMAATGYFFAASGQRGSGPRGGTNGPIA